MVTTATVERSAGQPSLSGADVMELRRKTGVTLEELAAEMGLSFGYLGRLEHESEPFSDSKRFAYLAALHALAQRKVTASKSALAAVEAAATRRFGR